jgi:hypothetical protein
MKAQSSKNVRIGTAALAVILATSLTFSLIPAGAVQASDSPATPLPDEWTPPQDQGEGWGSVLLEKALRREQNANENLSKLLDKSDKAVIRLEEAIAKGQENNQDVSALEDALEKLNSQIIAARADHDRSVDLLANPAGFDKDGQVTNRKVALETVKEIHQIQQDLRISIGNALKDALKTIREYYQDNPTA